MQAPLQGAKERAFLENPADDTFAADDGDNNGDDGEQSRVGDKTESAESAASAASALTMAQVCLRFAGRCCGCAVAGACLFPGLDVDVECALSPLHRDLHTQGGPTKAG